MSKLPKRFEKFQKDFPEVSKAYEKLGTAVHKSGPLNEKTRALIKLAISTGAGLEGAVHSHTRKAIETGCTKKEIKQTVMLALPTIGFPATMAVMSWVEDIIEKK
ncbi:MAG: carboxymuconolactone decarboxylase family protein [Ignavibacteriaceae bacterium]|nr:carboxymuconolactone decarboxylase family protein [Ignavibacteriaceae bacterium]MCW8817216.1 carboxymuconolactone decarboxylase family protein [Ignavibacteriaceae bacterium]MCW8960090.1 carboxymuconolactone decarboxylase family protein [Ignavibacteriaceae bacterium]MCW9097766.1 carboxymuconolactone decarboxylase family protein [Ignavibacteriaceae bacterium]